MPVRFLPLSEVCQLTNQWPAFDCAQTFDPIPWTGVYIFAYHETLEVRMHKTVVRSFFHWNNHHRMVNRSLMVVAFLTRLLCPACWPAHAGLLSSMGLTADTGGCRICRSRLCGVRRRLYCQLTGLAVAGRGENVGPVGHAWCFRLPDRRRNHSVRPRAGRILTLNSLCS